MSHNKQKTIYDKIFVWSQSFHRHYPPQPVDGEIYEQAGTAVYQNSKQVLETGGRIEINLITPEAKGFSWRAEITIDDAANKLYQHVLLQTDGDIVETYGKTVIPVSPDEAEIIFDRLARLLPGV